MRTAMKAACRDTGNHDGGDDDASVAKTAAALRSDLRTALLFAFLRTDAGRCPAAWRQDDVGNSHGNPTARPAHCPAPCPARTEEEEGCYVRRFLHQPCCCCWWWRRRRWRRRVVVLPSGSRPVIGYQSAHIDLQSKR